MTQAEAEWQAEKLREFARRGGDEKDWWRSKSFSHAESALIQEAKMDEPRVAEPLPKWFHTLPADRQEMALRARAKLARSAHEGTAS